MARLIVLLWLLVLTAWGWPTDESGERLPPEPTVEPTVAPTQTAQPSPTSVPAPSISVPLLADRWACYYGQCWRAAELRRVLWCESRWQLYPNDGALGEVGPAQFLPGGVWLGLRSMYPKEWGWLRFHHLRDPDTNIRLMAFAFVNGYARHWACY